MDVINKMNAEHAKKFDGVTKEETVELLKQNSSAAATAIRLFTDGELDEAAPVSLYANAIYVPVRSRGSRRATQLSPPRTYPRCFAG